MRCSPLVLLVVGSLLVGCDSADDTAAPSGGAGQGGAGQSGQSGDAGQSGTGQSGSGQAGTGQGGNAQGGTGQGGNGQSGSGQSGSGQSGSGQSGSGIGGTGNAGNAGAGGSAGQGGSSTVTGVSIVGTQLLVDGSPVHMKGVCWNPISKGQTHPAGLDFAGFADIDLPMMEQVGINTIRTYEPITDLAVLDKIQAHGMWVVNSVYPYGGAPPSDVTARVNAVKDHPAILMWVIGNEWNYNGLYVGLTHQESLERLNEVAALVKEADPTRPVATVYGELPSLETINAMPQIDIWGLNVYRGITFGDLFDQWAQRSSLPMFVAEFGADAYNANIDQVDPESQAVATSALTEEILSHSSKASANNVCTGGMLFEWADEWWKVGDPNVHDTGGSAPGGGPYPDQTFNEEWWGIVDIDRNARPALNAYHDTLATGP